jgi:hypothetical protein
MNYKNIIAILLLYGLSFFNNTSIAHTEQRFGIFVAFDKNNNTQANSMWEHIQDDLYCIEALFPKPPSAEDIEPLEQIFKRICNWMNEGNTHNAIQQVILTGDMKNPYEQVTANLGHQPTFYFGISVELSDKNKDICSDKSSYSLQEALDAIVYILRNTKSGYTTSALMKDDSKNIFTMRIELTLNADYPDPNSATAYFYSLKEKLKHTDEANLKKALRLLFHDHDHYVAGVSYGIHLLLSDSPTDLPAQCAQSSNPINIGLEIIVPSAEVKHEFLKLIFNQESTAQKMKDYIPCILDLVDIHKLEWCAFGI